MLTDWDYREVQSFDALSEIWEKNEGCDPADIIISCQEPLRTQLDLPMCIHGAELSKFFKHHYRSNWHNRGIMVSEMSVIRSQEGW
jgi:hypothetical protein